MQALSLLPDGTRGRTACVPTHRGIRVNIDGRLLSLAVGALAVSGPALAEPVHSGVKLRAVAQQAIDAAPSEALTTVVLEFAPFAIMRTQPHSGAVFAIVLAGTVRTKPVEGTSTDLHSGDMWTERPGDKAMLLVNPTGAQAQVLAVSVAPISEPISRAQP
jgi:quercetin dioxygenase-like cupin family protein